MVKGNSGKGGKGGGGKGNNHNHGGAGKGGNNNNYHGKGGGKSASSVAAAAAAKAQADILAAGPKHGGRRGERKMLAQAEQAASVARKASFEDQMFWSASARYGQSGQGRQPPTKAEEDALFGKQGAAGIDFNKYDSIEVTLTPKPPS